jgi:GT2 family glycosyltransferase
MGTPAFTLIVCTYMRPRALHDLLLSVESQALYPDEVMIVDGSADFRTRDLLLERPFRNLRYYHVDEKNRGLTRQRNFGIAHANPKSEVICFLDDDTVLEPDYFRRLLETYADYPNALGVGGYIANEAHWRKMDGSDADVDAFSYDGWHRTEPSRFRIRRRFGLDSDVPPGHAPLFSHGRSIGFLPPSGKVYPVQQLMGGVSSFRKSVFTDFSFSEYFEGYGLYEDADFTLRVSKAGPLYVNTAARLAHYHEPSGRPNQFRYGKMVVRNGWYVWRVHNPHPKFSDRVKWHAITLLLTGIRLTNVLKGEPRQAFTETMGRLSGWVGLFFKKPRP